MRRPGALRFASWTWAGSSEIKPTVGAGPQGARQVNPAPGVAEPSAAKRTAAAERFSAARSQRPAE